MREALLILNFIPFCALLRVGFLSDGNEDKAILDDCIRNSNINIVTLSACHHYNGLENVIRLRYSHQVNALIGSPCDEESDTVSRLAYRWGIPFLSTSVLSSQKKEETTLAMVPDYQLALARAMVAVMNEVGVTKVAVIHTEEFHAAATAVYAYLPTNLMRYSIDKLDSLQSTMGKVVLILMDDQRRNEVLKRLIYDKSIPTSRKFIVYDDGRVDVDTFFMDLTGLLNEYVSEIQKEIILANFVVIQSSHGLEMRRSALILNSTVTRNVEHSLLLCDAISLLNSLPGDQISIAPFLQREIDGDLHSVSLNKGYCGPNEKEKNLKVLAETVASSWRRSVVDIAELPHYVEVTLSSRTFKFFSFSRGFTGPIYFSKDGYRQPYFKGYIWEDNRVLHALSLIPSESSCNFTESSECSYYQLNYDINSTVLPLLKQEEIGECMGGACDITFTLLAALACFAVVGVALLLAFRYQRIDREIHQMSWRVAYEKVLQKKRQEAIRPGYRKISPTSSAGLSDASSCVLDPSLSYINEQKVFVKTFKQKRAVNLTRSDMKQLNQLKTLSHANINTFIGMTFNEHNELKVLWKYCSRKSLEHLIFEKGQRFRRTFQGSFLKHIMNGLQYIHNSPLQFHGSLFLSNCVVDAYWVVKLTDFGYHKIIWDKMEHREVEDSRSIDVDRLPIKYYELPPEILRNTVLEGRISSGSQKGDIYQLGMLIYQILFHRKPFADKSDMMPKDLITAICQMEDKGDKVVPLYPHIPEENSFTLRLTSIMQQCWATKLDTRPAPYVISDAVAREFEKEGKGNLVDQMLRIIDDYQENIESMISERTKFLEDALHRTENLLFQIMPRKVAEDLREGLPINPEMHTSVSVLVADVCKFTELCEACIPVHVIEILQDLYSSLDQIVSRFDTFKVENVGDNYLIVSGLTGIPHHLAEVCKIAIEVIQFADKYTTKHRQDIKLQLKVGISCGGVASGILGSSAPRFCLFGDTVNMACRMANLSEPGRIQITEGAANIIQSRYHSFTVEERGFVEVKGKGPTCTYWLTGCKDSKVSPT